MSGPLRLDESPYLTTFVLHALRDLDHPDLEELRRRALALFVRTMDPRGLWSYYSPGLEPGACPLERDTSACVAHSLKLHQAPTRRAVDREAFYAEMDERGRFYTWFENEVWASNDLDSVINANVVLYLHQDPRTEGACDWLNGLVHSGDLDGTAPYFPELAVLPYAMARAGRQGAACFEPSREARAALVYERFLPQPGERFSPLQSAFALAALAEDGTLDASCPRVQGAWQRLRGAQQADGGWPLETFFVLPVPPGTVVEYFGGRSLTTALVLYLGMRLGWD